MESIILVGMPSCGKSTLGHMLAEELGYPFLDTDDVIKEQNGCELQDIIDNYGRDVFMEREVAAVLSVKDTRAVIATGGSVVYSPEAMAHLKALGRVVYLCISYDMLTERIGDPRTRGVVFAPGFGLLNIYNERTALYEKYADVTLVETPEETTEQSVKRLIQMLK